jgi:cobalt-zinc-cadmium efflux system protein
VHNHHHSHGTGRMLIFSTMATTLFVVIELWAGLHAKSLALVSDAGHNFTDALSLVLALVGFYLQSKPADDVKTYGYHRGGVLAAFINALSLIVLSLFLFWESYQRVLHPQPVQETTMIVVAALGVILNVGILLGLRSESSGDVNIRAAVVHMFGDALSSVAIIAGAIAIHYTGWTAIDPLLSILIGVLIIWSAIDIIRESLNILLEGLPRGLDLETVTKSLCGITGVIDVHDVHIWSLGSTSHALSCHALIEDMPPSESDAILKQVNKVLCDRFHVLHTTIQFEHVRCAVSENGCHIQVAPHSHTHSHSHEH